MKRYYLALVFLIPLSIRAQIITTFAGNGSAVFSGNGGPATAAGIRDPAGGIFDKNNNYYFADDLPACRIRLINSTGIITTFAGNGSCSFTSDGIAATASELNSPATAKIDTQGNVYIADAANNRIRKVTVATEIITTVAGTGSSTFGGDGVPATAASIYNPQDICLDNSGNLYIADFWHNRIRKVDAVTGIIMTVAGGGTSGIGEGGPATAAQLVSPGTVAVDNVGNIYLGEESSSTLSNRVRKVDASGIITTIAGNGAPYYSGDNIPATAASISPCRMAFDAYGQLYIADDVNYRVYKIDLTDTLRLVAGNGTAGDAGDGGAATAAELNYPAGIAFDTCGNLYIPEPGNSIIRKIWLDTTCAAVTIDSTSLNTPAIKAAGTGISIYKKV